MHCVHVRQPGHRTEWLSVRSKGMLVLGTLAIVVPIAVNAQLVAFGDLEAIADVLSGEGNSAPVETREKETSRVE